MATLARGDSVSDQACIRQYQTMPCRTGTARALGRGSVKHTPNQTKLGSVITTYHALSVSSERVVSGLACETRCLDPCVQVLARDKVKRARSIYSQTDGQSSSPSRLPMTLIVGTVNMLLIKSISYLIATLAAISSCEAVAAFESVSDYGGS